MANLIEMQAENKKKPIVFTSAKDPNTDSRRFGLLKANIHKPPFNTLPYRVFWMEEGFGLHKKLRGTAVSGFHLADGEKYRQEGYNFERDATVDEVINARQFYLHGGAVRYCEFHTVEFVKHLTQHKAYIKWGVL